MLSVGDCGVAIVHPKQFEHLNCDKQYSCGNRATRFYTKSETATEFCVLTWKSSIENGTLKNR